MNSGGYDQKVKFVSLAGVADGYGGTIPGRTEVIETFASVKQQNRAGKDLGLEGFETVLNKTYQVRIRYRSGFLPTEDLVIAWSGLDLSIINIELNGERHRREYLIYAIENAKNSQIVT